MHSHLPESVKMMHFLFATQEGVLFSKPAALDLYLYLDCTFLECLEFLSYGKRLLLLLLKRFLLLGAPEGGTWIETVSRTTQPQFHWTLSSQSASTTHQVLHLSAYLLYLRNIGEEGQAKFTERDAEKSWTRNTGTSATRNTGTWKTDALNAGHRISAIRDTGTKNRR